MSGSLNLSLALKVLSKTALFSRLRIFRRTSVCPPRAVGVEISTSRQAYGIFSSSTNILRFTSMASISAAMVSSKVVWRLQFIRSAKTEGRRQTGSHHVAGLTEGYRELKE